MNGYAAEPAESSLAVSGISATEIGVEGCVYAAFPPDRRSLLRMKCFSSIVVVVIATVPTSRCDEHKPASTESTTLPANLPSTYLRTPQYDEPRSSSRADIRGRRGWHMSMRSQVSWDRYWSSGRTVPKDPALR